MTIRSEVMPVVICIYLCHIYLFTFIAEHSNWYCYNLSLLTIRSEVMPVVICIYQVQVICWVCCWFLFSFHLKTILRHFPNNFFRLSLTRVSPSGLCWRLKTCLQCFMLPSITRWRHDVNNGSATFVFIDLCYLLLW